MQCCSTSGIGQKQVINVCDGKLLGYITDIEFNICDGQLVAIIVGESPTLCLQKGESIRVPWCKIKCFGEDTILVDIVIDECRCVCREDDKRKKKGFFK